MKSKKGFTLVELLAVMIIISALSIIIIPSIINYINKNKRDISDAAKNIIYAGAKLYLDNNASLYPKNEGYSNCILLKDITDAGYLETPLLDVQSGRNIDLDSNYVKTSYVYDYDLQTLTYKYAIADSCETTIADGYELIEGSNIALTNKKIVDYKVYGNSVQDGTSTPSNPIAIENVGDLVTDNSDDNYGKYKIPITASGKNLFHKQGSISDSSLGVTVTYDGDTQEYTINGTTTSQGNLTLSVGDFNLDSGETFKFKVHKVSGEATVGSGSGITYAYALFSQDNSKYTRGDVSGSTFGDYTFNGTMFENSGGANNKLMLQLWRIGTTFNNFKIKIQIERGDDWTDFEPYVEPTTTNIYLDEPLRKLEDYSDYIDFTNKKVVRKIAAGTITNESTFGKFSNVTDHSAFYMQNNDLLNYYDGIPINTLILSPTFKYHAAGGANTNSSWTDDYQISSSITSTYRRIVFSLPNSITDVNDAKTWLQTNPINYYYPVNTTIEEKIDLPIIPSLTGAITYEIGTDTQPSKVEWLIRDK